MKKCSWWSQMKNICLQTCPLLGFPVINVNGSDPSTQCTITTIEIYSSMSKECLISVLLNKQSGRWSRQSEASARSSSSTSREDPYLWQVATASPGDHGYFWCGRVTGSSRTTALPHLCTHRHISNVSHQDEKGKRHWSERLITMKKRCEDQLRSERLM